MAYTPTNWVNDSAPAINATNLNKIETGIDDAHDDLDAATDAATAGELIRRDGSGRAKVATPSATGDIATKGYVDGLASNYATAAQGALADSAVQPSDAASTSAAGVVELATSGETTTGTDTTRAVTPSGLAATSVPKSLVDAKGDLLVGTADNTVGRLPAGTDGQTIVYDSGEATGMRPADFPSGGGGAPAYPAGARVSLLHGTAAGGMQTGGGGRGNVLPVIVPHDIPLSAISLNVTTSGSGFGVLAGLYSGGTVSDPNGATLAHDFGFFDGASSAVVTNTGSWTIAAGFYYLWVSCYNGTTIGVTNWDGVMRGSFMIPYWPEATWTRKVYYDGRSTAWTSLPGSLAAMTAWTNNTVIPAFQAVLA